MYILAYKAKEYWNNLLNESLDEAGVCWPNWPHSYNRHLHKQQKDGLEKILKDYSIQLEESSVCEIGPGSGFWSGLFYMAGVEKYKGFDITKNSIDTLSKKYPKFFFEECDFSEHIPLDSEICGFDIAISILVFLHITDNAKFEACFKNISSMLQGNGYFIVLDAVSDNELRGRQKKMADGTEFDENYHNKVRYLDYYISVANKNNMELVGLYPAFNVTQNSFDFKTSIGHKLGNWYFKKLLNPVLSGCSEKSGEILGKTLVWIDKTLFSKLSTSSKWLVFKKIA